MADNVQIVLSAFEALFNNRDYAAAQALNSNGVADLTPPESEIFSLPPDYLG